MRDYYEFKGGGSNPINLILYAGISNTQLERLAAAKFDILTLRREKWDSLEFLDLFLNPIRHLRVYCERFSPSGLSKCGALESLTIDAIPDRTLSFSNFSSLRKCFIKWHKNISRDIFDCGTLEELGLTNFKDKDLMRLVAMIELRRLDIRQSKIQSLNGIEELTNLEYLNLYDNHKLSDITGLRSCSELTEFHMAACKGLTEFSELGLLSNLRDLDLQVEKIESLDFLRELKKLKFLNFGDSTVISGDLSPVECLESLEEIAFVNKRGYSHKLADLRR